MTSDDWSELEKLTEQAEKSTREFSASTRGGAGSPIERRMADAFEDVAAMLKAQAEVNRAMREELAELSKLTSEVADSTNRLDSSARDIRRTVTRETRDSVKSVLMEHAASMRFLQDETEQAVEAIRKLDETATGEYEAAIKRSAGKLVRFATGAAAVICLLAAAGGLWALVGASWFVRMSPEVQQWATGTPALVVGIAVPLAIFFLGYAFGKDK